MPPRASGEHLKRTAKRCVCVDVSRGVVREDFRPAPRTIMLLAATEGLSRTNLDWSSDRPNRPAAGDRAGHRAKRRVARPPLPGPEFSVGRNRRRREGEDRSLTVCAVRQAHRTLSLSKRAGLRFGPFRGPRSPRTPKRKTDRPERTEMPIYRTFGT